MLLKMQIEGLENGVGDVINAVFVLFYWHERILQLF